MLESRPPWAIQPCGSWCRQVEAARQGMEESRLGREGNRLEMEERDGDGGRRIRKNLPPCDH